MILTLTLFCYDYYRHAYNISIKELTGLVVKAILEQPFSEDPSLSGRNAIKTVTEVGILYCCLVQVFCLNWQFKICIHSSGVNTSLGRSSGYQTEGHVQIIICIVPCIYMIPISVKFCIILPMLFTTTLVMSMNTVILRVPLYLLVLAGLKNFMLVSHIL